MEREVRSAPDLLIKLKTSEYIYVNSVELAYCIKHINKPCKHNATKGLLTLKTLIISVISILYTF